MAKKKYVKPKKKKASVPIKEMWMDKLKENFGKEPDIYAWLVKEIERLIGSTRDEVFTGKNIRWSEWGNLELDGIYDSIRNQTPASGGCIDKYIMHEPTKRVFRLGFSY